MGIKEYMTAFLVILKDMDINLALIANKFLFLKMSFQKMEMLAYLK